MYKLRWFFYVCFSLIGGIFFQKLIPNTNIIENAGWFLLGNILYELIDWRYNIIDEEEDELS